MSEEDNSTLREVCAHYINGGKWSAKKFMQLYTLRLKYGAALTAHIDRIKKENEE